MTVSVEQIEEMAAADRQSQQNVNACWFARRAICLGTSLVAQSVPSRIWSPTSALILISTW